MIAKLEQNSITLLTRATPSVLAVLPELEGRRTWLKGGGLRIENTHHNLERLRHNFPALELQGMAPIIALPELSTPSAFSFKRQPDPHQAIALDRCRAQRHFGLFMEQGTGKTKVAIDRACELFLAGDITAVLVVTKKGVHRQWIEAELPKDHSPLFKAGWWRQKALDPALLVQGNELKWFSINYDALRGALGFAQALAFCKAHSGKLLIVADESQSIMNHTSGRHQKMLALKPAASHRMLLTGTPIAKDLTDEWAQLRWLDEAILGIRYITTFRAQYCIMGGYEGRVVVGQKNMELFKSKVEPHTYRVTKAEIGYIPKHYGEWIYDLTSEQHRLIKQVKQELMAELECGSVVPIASATAAFTKVQQIANGFIIDEHGRAIALMPVGKNPRIVAALEWLDSHEGKAVIWTRFIMDRMLMAEAMRAAGISFAEYTGSNDQRHGAKVDFIEGDARVFLANPQSAGTGTDGLQRVCTQALYYSNSFNSIDRWQSEDRIDRRGMIGGANYTDLIARNSIDRYILRNLKKKKGLSAMSLDDINSAFDEEL